MTKKKPNLMLFILLFFMILIVEAIMDIVLAPADEVLVPADVIGDAALLAIMVMGALMSR